MLGDGDAHALEELVVEEGGVVGFELVAGEDDAVVICEGGVEVGSGEPGEPVHDMVS